MKSSGKLIMIFRVYIDPNNITEMISPYGSVSVIPFTAKVESELFTGQTLPGAVDVQQENAAGIRSLCAKYIFRGTDKEGNSCCLFVENNGCISPAEKHSSILHAYPKFLTDSPVLGEYFCQARFRSEVRASSDGVEIWIYDVCG